MIPSDRINICIETSRGVIQAAYGVCRRTASTAILAVAEEGGLDDARGRGIVANDGPGD
jgi:hypothetical protein